MGMEDKRDGTWHIGGTFAPALLQRGIEETLKQYDSWATEGITEGRGGKERRGRVITVIKRATSFIFHFTR
jgi:hypothetical protein